MILFPLTVNATNNITQKDTQYDWLIKHPVILDVLKYENEERLRYNLPNLILDTELCLLAQKHANWMAETGWYVHSNYGIPEIIHCGPLNSRDAVNGWIFSPAHHNIMLSGSKAGVGYMVKNGVTYWVTLIR
jgi:uncharacterized protein YkwD